MEARALLHQVTEPTRNRILTALMDEERTVSGLVEATGGEQSNISHHLRTLKDAGLVLARKVGRTRRYRLADPEVERLLFDLAALADRLEHTAYLARLQLPYGAGFHGYG